MISELPGAIVKNTLIWSSNVAGTQTSWRLQMVMGGQGTGPGLRKSMVQGSPQPLVPPNPCLLLKSQGSVKRQNGGAHAESMFSKPQRDHPSPSPSQGSD
jgi:hypothetical protein